MDRRGFVLAAAGASLSLAFEPIAYARRLGAGLPVAYVTADLESHIVVLDLATDRVLRRIRTGPEPRSIEALQGRVAIAAHTRHGVVSLLDAGTARLRAEVDGFAAPRYTAVHPRHALAYVTDSEREEIVVLDPDRARVLWRARVPGPARHISISRDGRTLWSALGTKAARVAVVDASDPRRPRLARTFAAPFLAHDVVHSPDGATVWVTSGDERRVALYRGRRLIGLLEAGAPPQHVAFARDGAFVAAGDDGTVRRHRLDGELVREVGVPVGSYNVTFDSSWLVTPSLGAGTLAVLDRNGRVQSVRRLARAAHDACIVFGT